MDSKMVQNACDMAQRDQFRVPLFLLDYLGYLSELGKSASPQIHNCGLTKNVADMRTCGLWQFKLRTCGCGLFIILVRNSASFIQILKFLTIFEKYSCFYPVKHEKSISFFRLQVRQKYQVIRVQADINTRSAYRLNRFLFVDMLFGNVRNEYMPRSHLLCK